MSAAAPAGEDVVAADLDGQLDLVAGAIVDGLLAARLVARFGDWRRRDDALRTAHFAHGQLDGGGCALALGVDGNRQLQIIGFVVGNRQCRSPAAEHAA
ncbi:MAG TPA: hypothetical protein PLY80_13935 [Pseudomonadota bacterium]|nr:hypothetical protein [Pseudomonadota bacterium]